MNKDNKRFSLLNLFNKEKRENTCYLRIYLRRNLGDDLFAKILSERYPNTLFITANYSNEKYNFRNIKIINGMIYKIFNKFLILISNNKISVGRFLAKKCKHTLIIGGSIFIEEKSNKYEALEGLSGFSIIGANFGPYKTKKYLDENIELFKRAGYVSFRDKASYLVICHEGGYQDIAFFPDIAYGINTKKIKNINSKKAVFSIIDCERKIDKKYKKLYEEKMIELAKMLINKGYEITFMSFCKNENDEVAIERILSKCDEKLRKNIITYYYRNNIDEALNVLRSF